MKNSPLSSDRSGVDFQNILVPIDFSELSLQALRKAQQIAGPFNATVHLFHVQEYGFSPALWGPGAPMPISPAFDFEEARAAAAMRLRDLAAEYGVRGSSAAEIGSAPFDMICWQAQKISADLIVTSTHGRTGLKRALLGSTAERLVQHAPCPVFVVREEKAKRGKAPSVLSLNTILAPIDFSDCSLGGLEFAIEFAERFAAKIVVAHALDLRPLLTAEGYGIYRLANFQNSAQANAEALMREFLSQVNFGRVKHATAVVAGPPADAICAAAREHRADLIVTVTHGRTGLQHVLIGSTAEMVVRHAPCPVLVLPSHPAVRLMNITPKPPREAQGAKAKRRPPNAALQQQADARTSPSSAGCPGTSLGKR